MGRTLVDASSWSARVLMVNPSADVIVLSSFSCVGNLVPVSAVSVALAEPVLPGEECGTLPDHLEDIVTGSHPLWERLVGYYPSLREAGRLLPSSSVCTCFPGARGNCNRTYHIGTARDPNFGRSTGTVRTSPAGLRT